MPGVEPRQNNFPATLAHQKKGGQSCSATENQSGWPSAEGTFDRKPFRVFLEMRLPSFLVRPAHCRKDTLSEPCGGMWSQTARVSGSR